MTQVVTSAPAAAPDAATTTPSMCRRAMSSSAWTLIGYGGGQALRFGSNLVLTRLLFPEAFGLMAIVGVVLQGLQMFSDIGIQPSIVQSRRGDDRAFLDTAWTIQALRGVALALVALAVAWPIARFYARPELVWLIAVSGVTALLSGFNSTALATLSRRMDVRRLTAMEIGAQVCGIVAMVIWAVLSPSVWALVSGTVVAVAVRLVWSHRLLAEPRNRFTWDRAAAHELIRFGRWIFVSTILTFLAFQLDRLLLGKLFDVERLGIYGVALALAQLTPMVAKKLGASVIFPLLSQTLRDAPEQLPARLAKIRLGILLPGLAVLVGLTFVGDDLVRLLYDARYADAGWMLQVLAAGWIAALVNGSASHILLARGESSRIALLLAPQVALLVVGAFIGHAVDGERGFVLAIAAVELLNYPVLAMLLVRRGVWQPRIDLPALALCVAGLTYAATQAG